MASRELINPPALHDSPGYSHIAVTDAKKLVFLAGQVALDKNFELIGGDDLYAQTRATVANAVIALEAGRCDLGRRRPSHDLHDAATRVGDDDARDRRRDRRD